MVLSVCTDFHPDRFYEVYSSTAKDAACHSGRGPAGIYGAETSECDSPVDLVNKTMGWVGKELKDKIDFVIWTGDSARHDNDEDHPRDEDQVVGLNKFMVTKMFETFGKHNGDEEDDDPNNDYVIPVVPNLGNNDILPHNILTKGPNKWTRTYAKMWKQFIPEEQRHQFEQGGWFYVEVIPGKLAVFSLNTLYFFTSNAVVDGCAVKSEPGYHQMEWLRIQLQFMRDRGMKVILTGHVPPVRQDAKTAWDETCWQKYTLWLRQYRDVIVSSHYGHFNYDHFILQDFKDLRKGTKRGKMPDYETEGVDDSELHAAVSSDYFIELRDSWSKLPDPPKSLDWPDETIEDFLQAVGVERSNSELEEVLVSILKSGKKKQKKNEKKFLEKMGGEYAERFAASFVSASVVPNLFPTLRVFEYNITGLDHSGIDKDAVPLPILPEYQQFEEDGVEITKKNKKYKFDIPDGPSKTALPGPAYSPQTLSLTGYVQYFANLTHINNDFHGFSESDADDDELDAAKWKEGKHKGKKPHNKDHTPSPKKFKYEVHYDTKEDDVYQLKDLTMPSLVDLARRIGNFVSGDNFEMLPDHESVHGDMDAEKKKKKKRKRKKKKKKHRKRNEAWYTFIRRAFVETLGQEELEEEFGD